MLAVVPADAGSPAANKAAVCVPALDPAFLPSFKLPPLAHVAAGIPAAFPKPFNVVPPDKNTEPSVKILAVGGASAHSSEIPVMEPVLPAAYNAADDVPDPDPPYLAVLKSASSVQLEPSQNSVLA